MSAAVETMMYTREKPWHGLGTMVEEAPNSADALRLAGLDWTVEQKPVFMEGSNIAIPNYKANVRSSDQKVLGVVTDRYRVVQNADAFAFTDELVGGDVRYETAGSLFGGRKIWLLAKMPTVKVLGDDTEPYLCFSNTHDGSGAVKVCMTPVRVVCNNTLNCALAGAKRYWSVKHVGRLSEKIAEAHEALELADQYMRELDKFADKMANKTVKDEEIRKILDELFPVDEKDSQIVRDHAERMKTEYMTCLFMPDIKKFRGTAWGAINAMADMVGHTAPNRQNKNYQENNWGRIMNGHVLMDAMVAALA